MVLGTKEWLIIFIMALFLGGCYSPLSYYDAVFRDQIDTTGQQKVFEKTRLWMVRNVRSDRPVIQHEDKESGVLISDGQMLVNTVGSRRFDTIYYLLETQLKGTKLDLIMTIKNREDVSKDYGDAYKNIRFEFYSLKNALEMQLREP